MATNALNGRSAPSTLCDYISNPCRIFTEGALCKIFEERTADPALLFFSLISDGKYNEADVVLQRNPQLRNSIISRNIVRWVVDGDNPADINYLIKKDFVFDYVTEESIFHESAHDKKIPVLHYALSEKKNLSFGALLNSENINLEATDPTTGDTVLHLIAKKNCENASNPFLDACTRKGKLVALVNKTDRAGKTAILIALEKNHIHVFQNLAQAPATDLTVTQPKTNKTLLFIVAERGDTQRFSLLMKECKTKGVLSEVMNTPDSSGMPLIFFAAEENEFFLNKLIEEGADLTVKHPITKRTLLHYFSSKNDLDNFTSVLENAKKQGVLLSIINEKDANGETALFIAAKENNYTILEQLIKAGADYESKVNGETPYEASHKFFCCMAQSSKLLWDASHGKNLNQEVKTAVVVEKKVETDPVPVNKRKTDALMLCLQDGSFEQAERLISEGVGLDFVDSYGNGPLLLVVKNTSKSEEKKLDLVKLIRDKGDDVNRQNASKESLLSVCARKSYNDILEELTTEKLDTSKNCNLSLQDKRGYTVLHHAVEKGNEKGVKKLLKAGADANVQNQYGKTPLHLAPSKEIAHLLLKGGALSNIKDKQGHLPVDYAAMMPRNDQVGKAIFSGSPDISTREKAQISGNMELANIVRAHENKGDVTEEDVIPKHQQKSDSLSGFATDLKDQAADQVEKLTKNTLKETGDAIEKVKTEAIQTLQDTAVGAIKTANLPGKVADLVGSVTSAAIDKAKDSLLEKINEKD